MKDRELLEMAAKAAGLTKYSEWADQIRDHDSPHYMSWALHSTGAGGQADSWNPLTDDGDALRLAVKLHMDIWQCPLLRSVSIICDSEDVIEEKYEGDPQTATRRAIVRAAAEIGRGLE